MNQSRRYLETQVMTAPREQLLLMLIDGAIRFTTQARERLAAADPAGASPLFIRAQAIALELVAALDASLEPSLRERLAGLYGFVYRRLLAANIEHDAKAADEALSILATLRAMWGEAIAAMKSAPVSADAAKSTA